MIVSFLTPTYNRGYILNQLYSSLCRQPGHDFEWIIIDDGSTDNTKELVSVWKHEAEFQIQYHRIENGGKHRAVNQGINLVKSPYTYIIDSDDYLVDNAVKLISKWIEMIDVNSEFAGVAGTRIDKQGRIMGDYPKEQAYIDASNIERRQSFLEGDKAEIYRTEMLKRYPFPEFEEEKFLSECAVWDRIGLDGYRLRWFPEALCICEYHEDGLTKTIDKEVSNYRGYTYVIAQQLKFEPWKKRLALIAQYDQVTRKKYGRGQKTCENLDITVKELLLARFGKMLHTKVMKKGL